MDADRQCPAPLPATRALAQADPVSWFTVFGPGAVIASLTIGTGELIFSTRAGTLFGYRILHYFLLVLLLKWALAYTAARHFVLTGVHPLTRSAHLPGPAGWFPSILLLFGIVSFPVWVCFHAGTLGTLLLTLSPNHSTAGAPHYLWGALLLLSVTWLALAKGYAALERVQITIVAIMLGGVTVSLISIGPDWLELIRGLFIPQPIRYPDWLATSEFDPIRSRPLWVEAVTYVGVIGGSSYDYLAYVAYLREKDWGRSAGPGLGPLDLAQLAHHPQAVRRSLQAPLIDCSLSFACVLIFTTVFVACGAVVLGPQHKVPDQTHLLTFQADFMNPALPWLRWLYFTGAFLALFGTLYGTIEVAPAVLREFVAPFPRLASLSHARLRRATILWVSGGAFALLLFHFTWGLLAPATPPPSLIAIVTPANLFTGVLGCGMLFLLNLWMDQRFLPASLRPPLLLRLLNFVGAVVFLAVGLKAYWDYHPMTGWVLLALTFSAGWLVARLAGSASD